MGSCASVDKTPDSAMKIPFPVCFKTNKILISSPIKDKPVNGEYPVSDFRAKPQLPPVTSFRDLGSKEESFFDSQAWLESDCEEDFFSVNGDFTPSRGNTPNYQSSFTATPRRSTSLFVDRAPNTIPEPSPTSKKKRLAELFRLSFGGDESFNEQNLGNGTPYISGVTSVCSSERTPNKDTKSKKGKLPSGSQCCLPSLLPSRRSSEKKTVNTVDNGED